MKAVWLDSSPTSTLVCKADIEADPKSNTDPQCFVVQSGPNLSDLVLSHKNYINNIIGSNLVENARCFWSYVKLKITDNIGVPTLKTATKVCNSDIYKAEAINDHFHSVFGIPKRKITLFDGVSPFESISSLSIDACGVLSQLRWLNPNKAHGPDDLSPQLLKLVEEELAPALTIIFQ